VFIFLHKANAQSFNSFFIESDKNTDSTKMLVLNIENLNFFKNNEYFNPYVQGYTLLGYWLKPQVIFNASKRLSFTAGIHAQKYSGVDVFSQFFPIFKVKLKVGENSRLIFGSLESTLNHNVSNYLLDDEFFQTHNCENGLQFIHQGEILKSDTWLDWRQFIFQGSVYPEILLFGTSNTIRLIEKNQSSLNLRLSALASHVGGQIDCSNTNVQTIINSQSGFDYYLSLQSKKLSKIRLFAHYYTALDQSPTKSLKYLYGYGVNSGIELSSNYYDLRLEHWFGEYYFSKFGNQMFNSLHIENPQYTEDQRAFVNTHLLVKIEKIKFAKMGFGLNFYCDLYNRRIDYSTEFYLKAKLNYNLIK
jgi:hypothetical protein